MVQPDSEFEKRVDAAIAEGAGILFYDSCYVEPKDDSPDQRVIVMKEDAAGHTYTIMIIWVHEIEITDEGATLRQNGESVEGFIDLPIIDRAQNVRRAED